MPFVEAAADELGPLPAKERTMLTTCGSPSGLGRVQTGQLAVLFGFLMRNMYTDIGYANCDDDETCFRKKKRSSSRSCFYLQVLFNDV